MRTRLSGGPYAARHYVQVVRRDRTARVSRMQVKEFLRAVEPKPEKCSCGEPLAFAVTDAKGEFQPVECRCVCGGQGLMTLPPGGFFFGVRNGPLFLFRHVPHLAGEAR